MRSAARVSQVTGDTPSARYPPASISIRSSRARCRSPSCRGQAGGVQHMLAQWADTPLFWTAIPYTMQPAGAQHIFGNAPPEVLKAFAADRAAMMGGMRRPTTADSTAQLKTYLAWLEQLL